MTSRVHRLITGVAVTAALLAVMIVPLCGGLFAAHLCPMEMSAMQGHGDDGCQGPAGPGIKRQTMDCCVAPQAGSPPALMVASVQVVAPVLVQPLIAPAVQFDRVTADLPQGLPVPNPDFLSLHSSLQL